MKSIEASDLGLKPGKWPLQLEYEDKTWYKSYPMGSVNYATASKPHEPGVAWVLYRTRNHEATRVYND